MQFITLISDWGTKDYYLSVVKAKLYAALGKDVQVIDISHHVRHFDFKEAAYLLKNAYPFYPPDSIHIIGLNSEASVDNPHLLVRCDRHYFIGADSGIFSLICDNKKPDYIIAIDIHQESNYFTFSTRDVFVKIAVHIARQKPLAELGREINQFKEVFLLPIRMTESNITGNIVYIDGFENCITDIHESHFKAVRKNREFTIYVKDMRYPIKIIRKAYDDVPVAEMLALFNSNGYLEIAINQANAGGLLGLKTGDKVIIEFQS